MLLLLRNACLRYSTAASTTSSKWPAYFDVPSPDGLLKFVSRPTFHFSLVQSRSQEDHVMFMRRTPQNLRSWLRTQTLSSSTTDSCGIMPVLYSIRYSPWSLRSIWALAYHDAAYANKEFLPSITDWVVRIKTRNFCGKLTVPVLIADNGQSLVHSFDISKWSSLNQGPKSKGDLFAGVDVAILEEWQVAADQIMSYSRILFFDNIIKDDEGVQAMLPGFIRKLGAVGLLIGKNAMKKTKEKYKSEPGANDVEAARKSLLHLRKVLSENGGEYIAGHLTYADIVMVIALHTIQSSKAIFPLKESIAKAFQVPVLADEFDDLMKWRDQVVQKHYFNIKTRRYDQ